MGHAAHPLTACDCLPALQSWVDILWAARCELAPTLACLRSGFRVGIEGVVTFVADTDGMRHRFLAAACLTLSHGRHLHLLDCLATWPPGAVYAVPKCRDLSLGHYWHTPRMSDSETALLGSLVPCAALLPSLYFRPVLACPSNAAFLPARPCLAPSPLIPTGAAPQSRANQADVAIRACQSGFSFRVLKA